MSDAVLERLKQGARQFRAEVYPAMQKEYLHAAGNPQHPHTLIVACADSRVAVEKIVSWRPGEVFITRNIGNMVPVYSRTRSEATDAVSAVIEYAVSGLKVEHIVICGHSDCGAMKALLDPASVGELPMVEHWLRNAKAAVPRARAHCSALEKNILPCLTEQNVLIQMEHLKTHPAVATAMERGQLSLSGWVYEIGTGEVRICKDGQAEFKPIDG